MFNNRECKCQREFSVPLLYDSNDVGTKHSRLELEIVVAKVQQRKWRVFKTYTQDKVVSVATGTLYQKPTGSANRKMGNLLGEDKRSWRADKTWRDYAEVDVDSSERDAIIDSVRELSLDIYEKSKVYGIDVETVFTQIMAGFIIGGDVPAPQYREDPYRGLRNRMKQDFYKGFDGLP